MTRRVPAGKVPVQDAATVAATIRPEPEKGPRPQVPFSPKAPRAPRSPAHATVAHVAAGDRPANPNPDWDAVTVTDSDAAAGTATETEEAAGTEGAAVDETADPRLHASTPARQHASTPASPPFPVRSGPAETTMTTRRTPLRWAAAGAVLLLLATSGRLRAEDRPLWLVVTRPAFAAALLPLAEHRRAQGFQVEIATMPLADALRSLNASPAYLLLVGDEGREPDASWHVPAPRRTLYRWHLGQKKDFAADALLGDLDDDLLPDVPVGRIPARTKAQVEIAVAKILAYERGAASPDDLRVVAWAGAPGYGGLLDAMATNFLVQTVRSKTPDWAGRYLLSAAPGHPLSGWPPDQPAIFNRELSRGAVLGAVIAHASATRVALLHQEGTSVMYGPEETASAFAEGPPIGPLVLLTCDCGAFDRDVPCLAESLLFLPGGPVATVAAATESHPLTNYFTGRTLLEALGKGKNRLGDLWVEAQRAGRVARSLLIERALKDAEGSLEEDIDVEQLRRDQVLMYALFGDPATRMRIPDALEAEVVPTEGGWRWRATRPAGATSLQVGVRRTPAAPVTRTDPADADREGARARFLAMNASTAFDVRPGPASDAAWEGEVVGPEGAWLRLVATGPGVFRVFTAKLERE